MADITVSKLGPGVLKFGAVGSEREFASMTTKTELTPSVEKEDDVHLLSGDILRGEDEESYELSGTFYQEYGTGTASLIAWCKENAGTNLPFTFTPHNSADGADLTVTGTVRIRAVKIGGDVKKQNTTDFTFPGIGDYTLGQTAAVV